MHLSSYAHHPQTNGVMELFNRTIREQVIYGHVFQSVDEVREAVLQFKRISIVNANWRRWG
ncbi:MAG: integrase core domain-containing protein [Armatimonadota bacterium]